MELRLLAAAGLLVLGACGYKGPVSRLVPPDPALSKQEQQAARADEKRRVAAGLTVPAAARPVRVDELTVKLGVRGDDPFNLPPEGTSSSRNIPFPGEETLPDNRPLPIPSGEPAVTAAPER